MWQIAQQTEFNNYSGNRGNAVIRKLTLALIALFLFGCESQELFSDLTETEANEIVAVLYSADLSADKSAEKGSDKYRVFTSKSSFSEAVTLLRAKGLPRERFESVGDVFQKDGFVSSPLEERARLNYAMSQELSRTISNIDGVIMARVHLAVPKKAHLAEAVEPSSASVFVKHQADVDLSPNIGKIKSLVVNGLENLPYDNVTVALFPAELRSPSLPENQMKVYKASVGEFSPATVFAALTVFLLSLVGLGTVAFFRKKLLHKPGSSRD
jgi:type III secretion protein J